MNSDAERFTMRLNQIVATYCPGSFPLPSESNASNRDMGGLHLYCFTTFIVFTPFVVRSWHRYNPVGSEEKSIVA